MSRFLIACSLIAALTTSAFASSAAEPIQFARPPAGVSEPDLRIDLRPSRRPVLGIAPARVVSRAAVRAKLLANRATNLASFRAYRQRGVFPSNTYRAGKLNVWIDEAGNLCAAATMINDGGFGDLVTRIGEQNNFIRLRDVTQGPVMDWILTSGLTQAEIVAIQEPGFSVCEPGEPGEPSSAPKPILVDADLRGAEDIRLTRRYKQVDAMIVKSQHKSIEAAVDRLTKRPQLAWQLVHSAT